jgi:hypothetical protein
MAPREPMRRYVQFARLFTIAEMLRQLHWSHDVEWITQEINERCGERWSERTIHRDLTCLLTLGLLSKELKPNRKGRDRVHYRWLGIESFVDPTNKKNRPTRLAKSVDRSPLEAKVLFNDIRRSYPASKESTEAPSTTAAAGPDARGLRARDNRPSHRR